MNPIVLLGIALAAPSPSPGTEYEGDPNLITPGVIGFAITFFIALATVLLLLDMTRRVRRVRYREEIRAELAEEARAGDLDNPESADAERADLDRKPAPPDA